MFSWCNILIICKQLSIWRFKKYSKGLEISTRVNYNKKGSHNIDGKTYYLKQFGASWCFIFISENNHIDRSCGLHHHPKSKCYFKPIYLKIFNKQNLIDKEINIKKEIRKQINKYIIKISLMN